jgi:hypothetical protein
MRLFLEAVRDKCVKITNQSFLDLSRFCAGVCSGENWEGKLARQLRQA